MQLSLNYSQLCPINLRHLVDHLRILDLAPHRTTNHLRTNQPSPGFYPDWLPFRADPMLESSHQSAVPPLAVPPPQVPQLVVSSSSRPQLLPVSCSEDKICLPSTQVIFVMSVLLLKKTKNCRTQKKHLLCVKYWPGSGF